MCAIAITSDEDGDEIKVFFDWVNDLANDPKPPLVHSVYVVSFFPYIFFFLIFITLRLFLLLISLLLLLY